MYYNNCLVILKYDLNLEVRTVHITLHTFFIVARVKGQSDATIGVNSPLTPQKKISVFTTGEAKNFLDDIFRILLRARRILSASYCIGYFIPDTDEEALGAHEVLQVRAGGSS